MILLKNYKWLGNLQQNRFISAMALSTMFDYDKVDLVVRRIITNANPRKIVIFGSVARHEAKDGSDLDILVVFDDDCDLNDAYIKVKGSFVGLKLPSDVVVMSMSEFNHYSKDEQSFTYEMVTTGDVVYAQ